MAGAEPSLGVAHRPLPAGVHRFKAGIRTPRLLSSPDPVRPCRCQRGIGPHALWTDLPLTRYFIAAVVRDLASRLPFERLLALGARPWQLPAAADGDQPQHKTQGCTDHGNRAELRATPG